MRRAKQALAVLLLLAVLLAAVAVHHHRRALPTIEGTVSVAGPSHSIEIVRDRWGVPHVFAQDDADAYFGLGWATAQDRLFQMEMSRRVGQGRLAELFGPEFVKTDRLFRAMDFHGVGRRVLAQARPEVRWQVGAYARGVNAYVRSLEGRLPVEFALLGIEFAPAAEDDFVGVLGFMAWGLNISWAFDPLYEKLVAKVGPERAAELFPYNWGASPSVYPDASKIGLSLFDLSEKEKQLLPLPPLAASNSWVIGPGKSASGHPILANDPHLPHGLPGIWYEAHVKTPMQDVIGVTIPGFPLVAIGHNRRIAWGFTNLMLDGADFFVEKVDPDRPDEVLYKGQLVKIRTREELIRVKGGAPVRLVVRSTPHGPIVSDFFPGQKELLSYRWTYFAAEETNDINAFYDLDRARNWEEFRAAARQFGAIAQNVAYADKDGHIGMQAIGAIPRLKGRREGTLFRVGWDGSEEWDGFIPFEEHPYAFDPPQGWLASANNPTLPSPAPYYISSQWEPMDRYLRIRGFIEGRDKLSIEDMKRLHSDTVLNSAVEETPMILEAFAGRPAGDRNVEAALSMLRAWDGDMKAESAAAAVFAVFYKHLFHEIFGDELGPELAEGYRSKANISAIMVRTAMNEGLAPWFDRTTTPTVEDKGEIVRAALTKAVRALEARLGADPARWTWGRLHTLELQHPVGRSSRLLGRYFNLGPVPVPGHNQTVNKAEFAEKDWRVVHGPSMRQITDLGDLGSALAVLPAGQSGIPASPHYDDQMTLWLSGQYHPLLLDRERIEEVAEGRLVLRPLER